MARRRFDPIEPLQPIDARMGDAKAAAQLGYANISRGLDGRIDRATNASGQPIQFVNGQPPEMAAANRRPRGDGPLAPSIPAQPAAQAPAVATALAFRGAGPQVLAGDPGSAASALRQAAGFVEQPARQSPIAPFVGTGPQILGQRGVAASTGASMRGRPQAPAYGKIGQEAAPADQQPRTMVNPGEVGYINGRQLGPGAAISPIDPKYGGGVGYSEQLSPNAPSYTGGANGKFVGPDEAARVARVGAEKASLASPDQVVNTLTPQDQQAAILQAYPQVGVADSPENKLFVQAYKAGGNQADGMLDLAHSLFKPRTPEQLAAVGQEKRATNAAIQSTAADLRMTPAERQAQTDRSAANQAKLTAVGKTVYDPDATATNAGRFIGDLFRAPAANAAGDAITKNVLKPIGNLFSGVFGQSPSPAAAATPASAPVAPKLPASPIAPVQPATPGAVRSINPLNPLVSGSSPGPGSFARDLLSPQQPMAPNSPVPSPVPTSPIGPLSPEELKRRQAARGF